MKTLMMIAGLLLSSATVHAEEEPRVVLKLILPKGETRVYGMMMNEVTCTVVRDVLNEDIRRIDNSVGKASGMVFVCEAHI